MISMKKEYEELNKKNVYRVFEFKEKKQDSKKSSRNKDDITHKTSSHERVKSYGSLASEDLEKLANRSKTKKD